jgi:hypothetical protein
MPGGRDRPARQRHDEKIVGTLDAVPAASAVSQRLRVTTPGSTFKVTSVVAGGVPEEFSCVDEPLPTWPCHLSASPAESALRSRRWPCRAPPVSLRTWRKARREPSDRPLPARPRRAAPIRQATTHRASVGAAVVRAAVRAADPGAAARAAARRAVGPGAEAREAAAHRAAAARRRRAPPRRATAAATRATTVSPGASTPRAAPPGSRASIAR